MCDTVRGAGGWRPGRGAGAPGEGRSSGGCPPQPARPAAQQMRSFMGRKHACWGPSGRGRYAFALHKTTAR